MTQNLYECLSLVGHGHFFFFFGTNEVLMASKYKYICTESGVGLVPV
jgi:hypothetical protein